MAVKDLRTLFHEQLQDLNSAESQILDALPTMIESARSDDLRDALREHLDETRGHLERLREVGNLLDLDVDGETCHGMQGIIHEGEELLEDEVEDDRVLDAAIVAAAQRVEHYEMAAYGTARSLAQTLGENEAASLLSATLEEEKEADRKLTAIAERHANPEATRSG